MSTAPRKRQVTKEETRAALIAAGAAEFTQNGIEGSSLDAICARAGFTRGAFYVHFKDRDDLLSAIIELLLGGFHDTLFATTDHATLAETITRYVAAVVAGAPATRSVGRWQYHNTIAACARTPAVRERYLALQRKGMALVATAARNGQRSGEVRDDVNADALAEILVILTMGLSVMHDLGYGLDMNRAATAVSTLVSPPKRKRAAKRAAR